MKLLAEDFKAIIVLCCLFLHKMDIFVAWQSLYTSPGAGLKGELNRYFWYLQAECGMINALMQS